MISIWKEERYQWTPFPERRVRVRLFWFITFTAWRWDT